MSSRGWTLNKMEFDGNVTLSDFLDNEGSDILYFTGHGTYNGFVLSPDELGKDYVYGPWDIGYWYGWKWLVFNSCETVNDNNLCEYSFSDDWNSVHAIMGFNEPVDSIDTLNITQRWDDYLFGDGVTQTSVWKAWRNAAQDNGVYQWSAFFLEGCRDELITKHIDEPSNYDVYYADNDWEEGWRIYTQLSSTSQSNLLSSSVKIEDQLVNGKIKLKYLKPGRKQMYSMIITPELSDFNNYEEMFLKNIKKNYQSYIK